MNNTLKLEEGDNEVPFAFIGINSPLSDFQIAYRLQNVMDWEFERVPDFKSYKASKNKEFSYNCLSYVDSAYGLAYLLVESNSLEDGTTGLVENLNKMDYVLLIIGRDFESVARFVCNNVRKVRNVVYAQVFYPQQKSVLGGTKAIKSQVINAFKWDIKDYMENNAFLSDIYV